MKKKKKNSLYMHIFGEAKILTYSYIHGGKVLAFVNATVLAHSYIYLKYLSFNLFIRAKQRCLHIHTCI